MPRPHRKPAVIRKPAPRPAAWPRTAASLAVLLGSGALSLAALAAPPGTVLPPGMVPQLRGVVSGAAVVAAPVPTPTGQLLNINQFDQRVVIDWNSFNIGAGSEVRFNQPGPSAAALNRIYDLDPSIIQGRLTANGQVYLLNQNGILFDRGSQVNVNTLIATTLNITQERFLSGIIGGAAFDGAANPNAEVRVGTHGPADQTARLESQPGGAIMLFAPRVTVDRGGIITAPDGQVILAAGNRVFLQTVDGDFSLRGLRVEINADTGPVNLTSLVQNLGDVSAARGNVTMAGLAINQMNRVSASSAVLTNGSIYLTARERSPGQSVSSRTGTVTLGPGSVTETPLDTTDATRLNQDQPFNFRPTIRVEGNVIHSQGRMHAPGGEITLTAVGPGAEPAPTRIYVDAASEISVAGNWADLPASANVLTARLTSDSLADSPQQRGGILQGETVRFDARRGKPPILSQSAFDGIAGGVQRSVQEKAIAGGDLRMESTGDIVVREGAVLDLSGGGLRYAPGPADVTWLVSEDRRVFDFSTAPKDLRYIGVLDRYERTDKQWGVTELFINLLPGRLGLAGPSFEGAAGGTLSVVAPVAVLAGDIRKQVSAHPDQVAANRLPAGARLVVGNSGNIEIAGVQQPAFLTGEIAVGRRAAAPADAGVATPAGAFGTTTQLAAEWFDAVPSAGRDAYVHDAFGRVELYAAGRVEVTPGTAMRLPAQGSLSVIGNRVAVGGDIVAPGGSIRLASRDVGLNADQRGDVTFTGGLLSTAGLWVNDFSGGAGVAPGPLLPRAIDGGSIVISTVNGTVTGDRIDVSGGARLAGTTTASLTYGRGGSIVIETGYGGANEINFGDLVIGSALAGFGGREGGTLSLRVSEAVVRPGATQAGAQRRVELDPGVFAAGGFRSYTVNALDRIEIASGSVIAPRPESTLVDPVAAASAPSGTPYADVAQREALGVLPPGSPSGTPGRAASQLTFNVLNTLGGTLDMRAGSAILGDPLGSVTLQAQTGMTLAGRIEVPGGSITAALPFEAVGQLGNGTLTVADGAVLDVSGTFLARPNDRGLLLGEAVPGGVVTLRATKNDLVIAPGALIRADGVTAEVDLPVPVPATGGEPFRRTTVAADAGAVRIAATQAARIDGEFSARAPAGSAGGSFAFDYTKHNDQQLVERDHRIVIGAGTPGAAPGFDTARLDVDRLEAGGFDKLRLQSDRVELIAGAGVDMGRSVRIDTPSLVVSGAGGTARIAAPRVTLANGAVTAPAGAAAGANTLRVEAGLIDLFGNLSIGGVRDTFLASSGDLRVTGIAQAGNVLPGSLVSPGNLHLAAAQVYPTTLTDFTFAVRAGGTDVPGGQIVVSSTGAAAGPAISAGGRLAFAAETIVQGGTVRAPLGELAFTGDRVELAPGSVTSVSGDGLVVPFGGTLAGRTWRYDGIVDDIVAPPDKRITLAGRDVLVRAGALVDLSGGGEIQGAEFVRGAGGSEDALLRAARADEAAFSGTFAILPQYRLGFEAFDTDAARRKDVGFGPLLATDLARADRAVYDSVYLSAGSGVPEGIYPLLPGYYALLPGAYAVRPLTASTYRDAPLGQPQALADGTPVVAGYRTVAGTDIRESRTSGFAVLDGAQVRRESEYRLASSAFFVDQAVALDRPVPPLPADAGALALSATRSLALDGTAVGRVGAPDAQRARVDIDALRIAVVDSVGQGGIPADALQISAARLSALDASVLLGGTRRARSDGRLDIDVGATDVTVAATASALSGSEIVLVAQETVTLATGAAVRADGAGATRSPDYVIAGDGALLRAATGPRVAIERTPAPTRTRGDLVIAGGATVFGRGAVQLDATRDTRLAGVATVGAGGSLGVASGRVSLGETDGITAGLVLSNAQLRTLAQAGSLALTSYGTIDFFGDTRFGSGTLDLTLDAAGLLGYQVGGRSSTAIAARSFTFVNGGAVRPGTPAAGTPDGTGAFSIAAASAVLGAGAKTIEGVSSFALTAAGELTAAGAGTLTVSAPVALDATRVVAAGGARQSVAAQVGAPGAPAYFDVSLGRPGLAAPVGPLDAAGGRLTVTGRRIAVATDLEAPSGTIELAAHGAGSRIDIESGGRVAVASATRTFASGTAAAPGGSIVLSAPDGSINVQAGGSLSVEGLAGADAGRLALVAQSVDLAGSLAGAATPGARGGSASLDVGTLASFASVNAPLEAGGFSGERSLRVRDGNVRIDQDVTAAAVAVAADRGAIEVAARIDASGARGGRIELDAGTRLAIENGAVLDASGATGGGEVRLSARDGAAGGPAIVFARDAVIDVSAHASGNAGRVVFAAPRGAGAVDARLEGTVRGTAPGAGGEVVVEGWRSYAVTAIDAGTGSAHATEYAAFMGSASRTGVLASLQRVGIADADTHVQAGIELRSTGDLALASPWDLSAAFWNAAGEPGHLALRAGGNLTVRNSLGLPDDNLAAARGWNLGLVGGADLAAASRYAVATQATRGDVIIANAGGANVGKVRTSTGDIRIAAGRDFVVQDPAGANPSPTASAAVVYTSGIVVPGVPAFPNGQADTRYAFDGGDIRIDAARDVIGATRQLQWVNDWLRRSSATANNVPQRDALIKGGSGWWTERADFRHNVGALAGGDVRVNAGGNIDGLSAMLPTSGRIVAPQVLEVRGGGDLDVRAGGDIRNGEFLVARGAGRLEAGGGVGVNSTAPAGSAQARAPVSLYLMGESTGAVPRGASFEVAAAGSVLLQNVSNPTIMASPGAVVASRPGFQNGRAAFFTYTPESALDVVSAGGDVTLLPRAVAKRTGLLSEWSEYLPPNVSIAALSGDVTSAFAFTGSVFPHQVYPSAEGSVRLLAGGDVGRWALTVLNAVPEQVPAWNRLSITRPGSAQPTLFLGTGTGALSAGVLNFSPTSVPQSLDQAAAPQYVIAAAAGDVYDSRFDFPRAAEVRAGGDVENVDLRLQNLGDTVSRVVAGRDIRYIETSRSGAATPPQGQGIEVRGEGTLVLQAGRSIDMGRSYGISALGNEGNRSLTRSDSADLVLLAGVKTPGDFDLGRIDPLFDGLLQAGRENRPSLGDAAADAAFAGATLGAGSIGTVFSPIQTFGGSDIVLLAPQGDVTAGLTVQTTAPTGIQTLRGGRVRSYLAGDFDVNQSKVLTARGGDIFIYSRDGSIDAGRGALTSRTTTPPRVIRDINGNLVGFDLGGDVAGAGIRTVTSDPDGPGPQAAPPAGDVFLFALRGTVDAGEAGIAGGGNVVIAAVQVLNASNVQGAGSVSGVPAAAASPGAASASAAAAGAAASRAADSAAERATEQKPAPVESFRPSFITVEVLGFGDDDDRRRR
jgi:filamentous hemagglutinin family protein